jgi:hypothetical protein
LLLVVFGYGGAKGGFQGTYPAAAGVGVHCIAAAVVVLPGIDRDCGLIENGEYLFSVHWVVLSSLQTAYSFSGVIDP